MYQHDLSQTALDSALRQAAVDAVAIVGADVNTASPELLALVPGLSVKQATAVIDARPLNSRADLLSKVKGLGPVAFRNAAGFLRVQPPAATSRAESSSSSSSSSSTSSSKPKAKSVSKSSQASVYDVLDGTAVHPEDYSVARILFAHVQKCAASQLDWPADLRKSPSSACVPGARGASEWLTWLQQIAAQADKDALRSNLRPVASSRSTGLLSLSIGVERLAPWFSTPLDNAASELASADSSVSSMRDSLAAILAQVLLSGSDPRLCLSTMVQEASPSSSSLPLPLSSTSSLNVLCSNRLDVSLANSLPALAEACPVRGIAGTVSNVTDFGAFMELAHGCRAGLLHASKLASR